MSAPAEQEARVTAARRRVAAGYDQIAARYAAARPVTLPPLLAAFAESVPDGSPVLDLGCGAGVPIAAWLSQRLAVTGVDLSRRQIALARRNVPTATLIQSDMLSLRFPLASFALIVAAYSIIHVPREEQRALAGRIAGWLRPGGAFLATWALSAWEGEEADWEGWGAPMWWSHYAAVTNLAMLRDAGFVFDEGDTETVTDGETWMWVLAHKPSTSG